LYQYRNYLLNAAATQTLAYGLSHEVNTSRYFPLYLFDLSGIVQIANAPIVCKRAYCDISGAQDGKIKWFTVQGLDVNGAGSPSLQRIEAPSGVASTNHSKSLLEYVDMKFSFMGATTRPTRILVSLVQFKDAEMDPWATDGTSSAQHQAVWQSLISRLIVNPLHDYKNPDSSAIKILQTRTIELQPISSDEADTRGHVHTMKWFHSVNKVLDYRQGGNQVTDDASFSSRTVVANTAGEMFNNVTDTRHGHTSCTQSCLAAKTFGCNP
jgi:hypothetical protein